MDSTSVIALAMDVLRILAAPAPVAGIVALAFRREIRGVLDNIVRIRYKDAEVQWQERELKLVAPPVLVPDVEPQSPARVLASPTDRPLVDANGDQAKRVAEIEGTLNAERGNAQLWEFRYLNKFLVANTYRALQWLGTLPHPVTDTAFDNVLSTWSIPQPERIAILNALAEHYLVTVDTVKRTIVATPKGQQYLQFANQTRPSATA